MKRETFGIRVVALWSLVLGGQNAVRLLFASTFGEIPVNEGNDLIWFYLYQWVGVFFVLFFFAATIGLWLIKNWGRNLFIYVSVLYLVFSMIGLYTNVSSDLSTQGRWLLAGRYIISTILPIVYLNLDFMKARFDGYSKRDSSNNPLPIEENIENDQ